MRARGAWLAPFSVVAGGCVVLAGLDGDYSLRGSTAAAGGTHATASSSVGPGGSGGIAGASGSTGGGGTAAGGAGGAPGPECGNMLPEQGEECDDGNTEALDGCSASCTNEDPDSCNAAPIIVLEDQQSVVVMGDSTGAVDDIMNSTSTAECGPGTWLGPDHVWAVVPAADGVVSASLSASFDYHFFHMRAACPGTTDLGCDYSQLASTPDDFTVNVSMGQTYFLIVDNWGSPGGGYALTVQLN